MPYLSALDMSFVSIKHYGNVLLTSETLPLLLFYLPFVVILEIPYPVGACSVVRLQCQCFCCVVIDNRLQARDSSAVDIDIQHSPPGFINEMYCYTVTVTNNEPTDITNIRCVVDK